MCVVGAFGGAEVPAACGCTVLCTFCPPFFTPTHLVTNNVRVVELGQQLQGEACTVMLVTACHEKEL